MTVTFVLIFIVLLIIIILDPILTLYVDQSILSFFGKLRALTHLQSYEDLYHSNKALKSSIDDFIRIDIGFQEDCDLEATYTAFVNHPYNISKFQKYSNYIKFQKNKKALSIAANHYYVNGETLFNLILNGFGQPLINSVNSSIVRPLSRTRASGWGPEPW